MNVEMMQSLTITATLVGGGAAGAIIKMIYDTYIKRPQSVGANIDVVPMLPQMPIGESLSAKLLLSDNNTKIELDNLYHATIDIENIGNEDKKTYTFGISLFGGYKAIYCIGKGRDRHHQISINNKTPLSLCMPTAAIDLDVIPFNRGDKYTCTILFTIPNGQEYEHPIKLSSPDSYRIPEEFSSIDL